ncbi:uncharacterized protein BCR38DRAFT_451849 [Pseudomassariella vexata]|uniref:Uncharacterized protein n=1 Tax=Pseudomassariella vexata TaxID=1141098 RepID=A0A1Y2D9F0_9PEZI|nr:uncharacterized protein BCR38DRAFT_451849 [Pseudomassariella vexata]ORY55900.1 hypothetical protein BCR38DRAFT_451849 [Pseudomassariella vexata]
MAPRFRAPRFRAKLPDETSREYGRARFEHGRKAFRLFQAEQTSRLPSPPMTTSDGVEEDTSSNNTLNLRYASWYSSIPTTDYSDMMHRSRPEQQSSAPNVESQNKPVLDDDWSDSELDCNHGPYIYDPYKGIFEIVSEIRPEDDGPYYYNLETKTYELAPDMRNRRTETPDIGSDDSFTRALEHVYDAEEVQSTIVEARESKRTRTEAKKTYRVQKRSHQSSQPARISNVERVLQELEAPTTAPISPPEDHYQLSQRRESPQIHSSGDNARQETTHRRCSSAEWKGTSRQSIHRVRKLSSKKETPRVKISNAERVLVELSKPQQRNSEVRAEDNIGKQVTRRQTSQRRPPSLQRQTQRIHKRAYTKPPARAQITNIARVLAQVEDQWSRASGHEPMQPQRLTRARAKTGSAAQILLELDGRGLPRVQGSEARTTRALASTLSRRTRRGMRD